MKHPTKKKCVNLICTDYNDIALAFRFQDDAVIYRALADPITKWTYPTIVTREAFNSLGEGTDIALQQT
jgi:hypothetical protein